MWKFGLIEIPQGSKNVRVRYEAKVFEEGSKFGIEGGRISKLWASINGETILNYDHFLDPHPLQNRKGNSLIFVAQSAKNLQHFYTLGEDRFLFICILQFF